MGRRKRLGTVLMGFARDNKAGLVKVLTFIPSKIRCSVSIRT
jgi:hypothetical protein